jgi:hypothetical protein
MKALLTLLILGTSSVALAQPAPPPSYDHRYDQTYERSYDRQARWDDRFDRGRFRAPIMLAPSVTISGRWNQQLAPTLVEFKNQRVVGLRRMQFDSQGGRMYLDTVVIHFADGRIQTVRPHQTLSQREPSVIIDLDQGQISSMYVYATPMRGRAAVDVVGVRR